MSNILLCESEFNFYAVFALIGEPYRAPTSYESHPVLIGGTALKVRTDFIANVPEVAPICFQQVGNDDAVSVPVGWDLAKVSRIVFIADVLKTIFLMSASQDPTCVSRLTN